MRIRPYGRRRARSTRPLAVSQDTSTPAASQRSASAPAAETDRARQLRKRSAAVLHIKTTHDYCFRAAIFPAFSRPATPDPTDLCVSKRRWEEWVMQ